MKDQIQIERYSPEFRQEWDAFIKDSRNGTFLFYRDYMDYHADRFEDCSLLFRRNGRLLAVLPANCNGGMLLSHQGLTYGGLVLSYKCTSVSVLDIFSGLIAWLKERNISGLLYKCIPYIYHRYPAQEDLYALFRNNARLTARNISTAIPLQNRHNFSELRRRGVKKAVSSGIIVREDSGFDRFWNILEDNLSERYKTKPVHSVPEITLLKERFPENIRLYTSYRDNEILAGCVTFEMNDWVHSQYISASPEGKEGGALDLLFHYLITERYAGSRIFDFGQSTEDMGRYLNHGLVSQKEGFGGRGIVYDTYELTW